MTSPCLRSTGRPPMRAQCKTYRRDRGSRIAVSDVTRSSIFLLDDRVFPDISFCLGVFMRFEEFSFGAIRIDGATYEYDVVIDRGEVSKRRKKASRKFRDEFGHTPLSTEEKIPWKCRRLVVGTGANGRLPVMDEVEREAGARGIDLLVLPTVEAIKTLQENSEDTNAILHVTC